MEVLVSSGLFINAYSYGFKLLCQYLMFAVLEVFNRTNLQTYFNNITICEAQRFLKTNVSVTEVYKLVRGAHRAKKPREESRGRGSPACACPYYLLYTVSVYIVSY